MAFEGAQPLKVSIPVSAALAQAIYNESFAGGAPAQYTFVIQNASGYLDLVANNTDVIIGVLQNKPCIPANTTSQVAGAVGEVVVVGQTKVVAGGTITLAATTPGNALIVSVATNHVGTALQSGSFVTSATGKSVVGVAVGQSLAGTPTVAIASGDLFDALVSCVSPLPIGA